MFSISRIVTPTRNSYTHKNAHAHAMGLSTGEDVNWKNKLPNNTDLIRISQLQEFQEIDVHPSFERDRVYDDMIALCIYTWTISPKADASETKNLGHDGYHLQHNRSLTK